MGTENEYHFEDYKGWKIILRTFTCHLNVQARKPSDMPWWLAGKDVISGPNVANSEFAFNFGMRSVKYSIDENL